MSNLEGYVCVRCGHHQDIDDGVCDECGSFSMALVSMAYEWFGDDYVEILKGRSNALDTTNKPPQ